ncbi:MAG: RNA pseudouridine synthase [Deltaproteobacteria bacterium]|nr:RNA pseudouridine synthase [Deltaproteobacteria bacterium]
MTALTVLLRQGGILVVHKPPGMLVVPGRNPAEGPTVPVVVARELGIMPPRVCHRLDRDTSGALVLAETADAHRELNAQFERHLVRKSYLALVAGCLETPRVVDAPLGDDVTAPRGARARQAPDPAGKPARTLLVPVRTGAERSLVAARPATGRTHQVRAHLAHAGHPLEGDVLYGGPPGVRPLLHAAHVAFRLGGAELSAGAPAWEDLAGRMLALGWTAPSPAEVDATLTAAVRQLARG